MKVAYKHHLEENYYMTVDNDYPVVNIRKWWMPPGNGEIVPTKNGAAITFDQWETLKELMSKVGKKIGDQLKEIEFSENF
uniref:Transcriptional coactivator p15 (PC4) C-terminal domain-containing protein n=1 Tax=Magallana gigas TaxID=29159 RepID=K1Q7T4_MAGGI